MTEKKHQHSESMNPSMPLSVMADEQETLRKLTDLIAAVSAYVRDKNLAALKAPRWTLALDEIRFSTGKRLHRLYFERSCVIPKELIIIGGVPFSLTFFAFYAIAYLIVMMQLPAGMVIGSGIITSLFVIPMTPVILFNALGAYWLFIEILMNRRLSWWIRVLALGIVGAATVPWFTSQIWRAFGVTFSDPAINQAFQSIQSSIGYGVVFGFLVAIPAMIYFLLGGLGGFVSLAIKALSGLRWLFRFHTLESPESLTDFLLQPIIPGKAGEALFLLNLSQTEIQALGEWAKCRRELVQSRLLPTTLLLAFVGLLANTSLADSAVYRFGDLLEIIVHPTGFWPWLGAYFVLLMILGSGWLLVQALINLANESFVMDYLTIRVKRKPNHELSGTLRG